MTEEEFKQRWRKERSRFERWGRIIVKEITNQIAQTGRKPSIFFKVPPSWRLKEEESLVDKAFYRKKNYKDPFDDIEDKVGARFVVLLLDDITLVRHAIESSSVWDFDACKNFEEDKEKDPLLFTYQSVHYILRPKKGFEDDGLTVSKDTPCEVQIRTLLQHAHAELTHDSIYKSKKEVKPSVHRTVAKSMALIETTDEFFVKATHDLNSGPLVENKIVERLDGTYQSFVGATPHNQKSTLIIWGQFEDLATFDLVEAIQNDIVNKPQYQFLGELIKNKYSSNVIYQQSVVLFLYWMLARKKKRLLRDWPTSTEVLEMLASDVGVSLS